MHCAPPASPALSALSFLNHDQYSVDFLSFLSLSLTPHCTYTLSSLANVQTHTFLAQTFQQILELAGTRTRCSWRAVDHKSRADRESDLENV